MPFLEVGVRLGLEHSWQVGLPDPCGDGYCTHAWYPCSLHAGVLQDSTRLPEVWMDYSVGCVMPSNWSVGANVSMDVVCRFVNAQDALERCIRRARAEMPRA